ncbi:hypothetical protein CAPTEDRAFT_204037 [Capitella teleta]|uniref:Kinetochore protein Spc24 n=1 Tax=Capitella teleta TaxID=283909 RepID=R7TLL8_CAPTE|nr:hypothetical protein CAPTEDRAFT_204037 [Capitella teleta]|eukprot:ELT94392.1 hypothetical protein CAPTEDRAFT_204037 [Capitella teleta]
MDSRDFGSLISDIDEVVTVLHSNDAEHECIKQGSELAKVLTEQQGQQESVKQDIKAMTLACAEEEKSIEAELQYLNEKEITSVSEKLREAKGRKEKLSQELNEMQHERHMEENKKEELEKKREELENTTTKVLPSIRHDINLYKYISGIRWQYDGPCTEVKGCILTLTVIL